MKNNNPILHRTLNIVEKFALPAVLLSFFIIGCSSKFKGPNNLYYKEDYKGAISEYNKILEKLTKTDEKASAIYNIAFCYFKLAEQTDDFKHRDYENAKSKFIQLVENFPDYSHIETALFQVAFIANRQGKSREAIDYALALKKQFPDSKWIDKASFIVGIHYGRLQNFEASRNIFRSIMQDSPAKEQAHYQIAMSFFEEENYKQAYQEFDKLFHNAENPDLQISAMYQSALCLVEINEHNKALEIYSDLRRQFPDSKLVDDALLQSGLIYNQLENYSSALDAFKVLLREYPGSEFKDEAQYSIAMIFYNEGKYEEAYEEFKKFSSSEFKDYRDYQAETMYYAALCLIQLDSPGAALNSLKSLIKKFPESEWVDDTFLVIGELNFYQGNFEEAINAYQSIGKKYPNSDIAVQAELGIANSYFQLGKWLESIDTYESFISNYSEHKEVENVIPNCANQIGEAYYKLATDQHKNGEKEKAKVNLEKALDQYQKTLDDFSTDKIVPNALHGMIKVLDDLDRKGELEHLAWAHGISEHIDTTDVFSNVDLTGLSYFRLALTQEKHLNNYKEALISYEKAIPLLKNRFIKAQSYYRQGLVYQDKLTLPDHNKALKVFNELISEYSNSENPSLTSMVADAKIRRSKILGEIIPEEEKRKLITQKVLGATVRLDINDSDGRSLGRGSGFFVGPGQIVTNHHVVASGKAAGGHAELGNMRYDIQGYTVMDVKHDLIILKVSGLSPPELIPGDSDTVQQNREVFAVGTPLGKEHLKGTISDGIIGNIIRDENGKRTLLHTTCSVSPGNSGGPLITYSNGEVVGVVVSSDHHKDPTWGTERAQNINYAVPVNRLKTLIQKAGPLKPLRQVESLWQVELAK